MTQTYVTYLLDRDEVLKNIDPDRILPDWMTAYIRVKIMELPVHSTVRDTVAPLDIDPAPLKDLTIP